MRQSLKNIQKAPKQVDSLRDALLEVMDDDQKRRWSLDFQDVAVQEIDESIQRVRNTLGKAGLTPSALEKHVGVVASVFKRLDLLVSVGAEASGTPAAFAWGAIKVAITALIELASVRKEVMEATVDGIGCIVEHLPRILEHASSVPGGRSSLADRAVDLAFREIIDFLVAVASYFSQRKIKQIMFSSELVSQIKSAKATLIEKFRNVHFEMCAAEFKKANQYREDAQYHELLRVLNAVNVGEDLFSRDSYRMDGTCSWTKTHPQIANWLGSGYDDLSDRRLWLYGGPGTGKSTVAAYLIHDTQDHQSDDEIVIYFFCNYHDTTKRSTLLIICTLITQLMESKTVYRPVVQRMMDHVLSKGSNWKFGVIEMGKRFIELLGCYTKARIIIDALEECPDDDAKALISLVDNALMSHPQLKVLLVSRPEQHVREHLKDWTHVEIGGESTTQDDIQSYVAEEVARMVKEVPHLRHRQEALRLQFLEATGSMFLFARLAIQNIIDHKHFSPRDVDKLLQTLPQGLHAIYEQYLENLIRRNDDHKNKIGRRVLQWLVCSEEPVSLELLSVVLAFEGEDDGLDVHQIPHNLKELLNQVLGILVTCRPGEDNVFRNATVMRVHLVHQSLSDFLRGLRSPVSQEKRSSVILPLCKSMQAGHFHLLSECTKALCSMTIRPMYLDYLDATDLRRGERPKIERLKCPEARRGDVMYGTLETHHGERGQRKHWRHWEPQWYLVQLQDLNRTWRAREAREQQAMKGLTDLKNVPQKQQARLESMRRKWEDDLEEVHELQSRQKAERSQLDTILSSREREFIVYSQRNLSRHVVEAASTQGFLREWQLGILFLTCISLRDALQAIPMVSSAVQEVASTALMPLPHVIELSTALHSLLMSMQLFSELPLVDNLHMNSSSQGTSVRSNLPSLLKRLRQPWTQNLEIPELLFHPVVHEALKSLPSSELRPFAIAAHIISNSRRVETGLFRYDEQHSVAVGTARLIYVLQGAYEGLSRWIVLSLIQLSKDQEHITVLRNMLMGRDFFLSQVVKRAYERPDIRGAEGEVQYVVHDDALPPGKDIPSTTSATSAPSTSLVPTSGSFGLVSSRSAHPELSSPNIFVRLLRPSIIWLILLSGFTDYLPTSTILLFTLLSLSLPTQYHVDEVGCILAIHRLFRSLPGYRSSLPLLLLTTTNIPLWILPPMIRPFLDIHDEESKSSIPTSSSSLWSITYNGDLCVRFPSQHGPQFGIMHTKALVERLVGIFALIARFLPNNTEKGIPFWGLALCIVLLPLIWKPFSSLSILSLLFLCLHHRIQTVLDPGQLLRARHLLADTQAQSHTLLPEMNTLYEKSRKALVDEYVRWTVLSPDTNTHDLKKS